MHTVTIQVGSLVGCCVKACKEAKLRGTDVLMLYNDTSVIVTPRMSAGEARSKWIDKRIEDQRG